MYCLVYRIATFVFKPDVLLVSLAAYYAVLQVCEDDVLDFVN